MDQFSYLSVLLSIIIGLAITQVLKGFRGIVLARRRVVMYWPVVVWAVLLLAIDVQSWWASFGLRWIAHWTFPEFAVVLLQTTIQYMLAALVFPDFFGDEPTDLREHYYGHTGWFFSLLIALFATSLSKDLVIDGRLPESSNVAFHMAFLAGALGALCTRREGYHKAVSIVGLLGFAVYTMALFSRLR
ncbi:MAG TPA: hypothetical protein VGH80_02325 [Xanthomonadaceae bacterium]|jgi:hypothetical protein